LPDPDRTDLEVVTGGAQSAPRSLLRLARSLVVLLVVFLAIWGATAILGRLPSDTSATSLVVRGALGLSVGLVLIVIVRRMLRALAAPPPAPPRQVDARASEVVYTCPVCGTRVRLEVAVTAKPPKHCGEEMEATLG
jgi:hypothetical protein